jgi:hypothetical protein
MSASTEKLSATQGWILALLFVVPLSLMAAKWPALPTSEFLMKHCSLRTLPPAMQRTVSHILFVPLGAILVVFFRLTLGIRVLGPFRSILLAIAFQITGIPLGLVFLVVTVAVLLALRRPVQVMRLPYFGRISVLLSGVALLMVLGILSGTWLQQDSLHRVAYFPMIVLCLIVDAIGKTVAKEGLRSALWRSTMTVLVAVLLALLAAIQALKHLLLCFPELLIAQIGCIVLISKFLAWRQLQWLNPKVGESKEDEEDSQGHARYTAVG